MKKHHYWIGAVAFLVIIAVYGYYEGWFLSFGLGTAASKSTNGPGVSQPAFTYTCADKSTPSTSTGLCADGTAPVQSGG